MRGWRTAALLLLTAGCLSEVAEEQEDEATRCAANADCPLGMRCETETGECRLPDAGGGGGGGGAGGAGAAGGAGGAGGALPWSAPPPGVTTACEAIPPFIADDTPRRPPPFECGTFDASVAVLPAPTPATRSPLRWGAPQQLLGFDCPSAGAMTVSVVRHPTGGEWLYVSAIGADETIPGGVYRAPIVRPGEIDLRRLEHVGALANALDGGGEIGGLRASPDERFLVFDSSRPDNVWTEPRLFGAWWDDAAGDWAQPRLLDGLAPETRCVAQPDCRGIHGATPLPAPGQLLGVQATAAGTSFRQILRSCATPDGYSFDFGPEVLTLDEVAAGTPMEIDGSSIDAAGAPWGTISSGGLGDPSLVCGDWLVYRHTVKFGPAEALDARELMELRAARIDPVQLRVLEGPASVRFEGVPPMPPAGAVHPAQAIISFAISSDCRGLYFVMFRGSRLGVFYAENLAR